MTAKEPNGWIRFLSSTCTKQAFYIKTSEGTVFTNTKAFILSVSNHIGLMFVHSRWGSVSVFFRSQIHPKMKGPTLSWNKTVCFNHVKKLFCTRCTKGKEKVKEGQERKGGKKDLRRKDERRKYGEDKHSACVYVCVSQLLSHVRLYATPWTVALQAPLSMEFSCKNTGVGSHSIL